MQPSDRVKGIGHQMKVDAVTAEVTARLARDGIRTILLKGPSFARWLYDDRSERPYGDTDLLVAPAQAGALAAALADLGFEVAVPRHELDRPVPAVNWIRRRGGAAVDVHVGLTGCRAPHEVQWETLSLATERWAVGGVTVEVLPPPARALHVVLHAAQHGTDPRPLHDLSRAVARLPEETWREAARLAGTLDALPAFAGGLHLLDEGRHLAARLDLPDAPSVEVLLRREQPPLALGLEWLSEMRGGRVRLVLSKLFPPPSRLAPPPARRTPVGWAGAYGRHLWRMTTQAWPAWRALRRARRGANRPEPAEASRKPDQTDA